MSATTYSIDLKSLSDSVVLGGTMEFQATLLVNGSPANGDYEVFWTDNMYPPNTLTVSTYIIFNLALSPLP